MESQQGASARGERERGGGEKSANEREQVIKKFKTLCFGFLRSSLCNTAFSMYSMPSEEEAGGIAHHRGDCARSGEMMMDQARTPWPEIDRASRRGRPEIDRASRRGKSLLGKNKRKLRIVEDYDIEAEKESGKYGKPEPVQSEPIRPEPTKPRTITKQKTAAKCTCGTELAEASWSVVRELYYCHICHRDYDPKTPGTNSSGEPSSK